MTDPLDELIRQSTEAHNAMILENSELDRAFQGGTFGEFVQSRSSNDGGGSELEGEASAETVGGESGGESGGAEAIGSEVQ
ncbi:hypothetical protein [Gimesia sp.]|uniref:hypothetical protein n=1 Tax=Gimesia sp. TaxID=2024833 RepID=UPI000C3D008F|nr:hypothetical protein [Gimesia sp.]MAX37591.1 hypothetical protein [Gimesia sp.]HAH47329.1 hypothetical protein [Planctomycetaceae bacterium]|tara:strand:+ start:54889 stop:55131 length:243 start_codon:yes stop_codon:yes gene_type:complete